MGWLRAPAQPDQAPCDLGRWCGSSPNLQLQFTKLVDAGRSSPIFGQVAHSASAQQGQVEFAWIAQSAIPLLLEDEEEVG